MDKLTELLDYLSLAYSEIPIWISGVMVTSILLTYVRIWYANRVFNRSLNNPIFDSETIKEAARYYIPPDAVLVDPAYESELRPDTITARTPLFNEVDSFLNQDSSYRHLLLLAEPGMGKTAFVINYFVHNLRQPRKKRHHIEIVPLGSSYADEYISQIEGPQDKVIILDGLDEDSEAIRDYNKRLNELISLCHSFRRVLITCRTQFFPSDEMIPRATGIVRFGPRGPGLSSTYEFRRIYLAPFNDRQVKDFLRKRYPIWQLKKRRFALKIVEQIHLLSMRPMVLAYIPDLAEQDESVTSASELYDIIIEKWIRREESWIDPAQLLQLSQDIAIDIYQSRLDRGESITQEALTAIANNKGIPIETWALTGRSLLNRTASGMYKFAHRSILEFLLAKAIIANETNIVGLDLSDQIQSFLDELFEKKYTRLARAENISDENLVKIRHKGDPFKLAETLTILGYRARKEGQIDQAREFFVESREIYQELSHPFASILVRRFTDLASPEEKGIIQQVCQNFYELWETLLIDERSNIVGDFCEIFSKQTAFPLKKYLDLSEDNLAIATFDLSTVFGDMSLPFSDEFPMVFVFAKVLEDEHLDHIRQSLSSNVGPSNRRAMLIHFCSDEEFTTAKSFVHETTMRTYAYDMICIGREDLDNLVRGTISRSTFRNLILSQIDLTKIATYNASGPTPDNMFFGRENELQTLCNQVFTSDYILVGGRRVGKTSILKQLERVRLPASGFQALYHDCSYTPDEPTLIEALYNNQDWFPESQGGLPSSIANLIQRLPTDKPLVLLFDEFDKLIGQDQKSDYPILNSLRALSNAGRCHFILGGEVALLNEAQRSKSPLFNFGDTMFVGCLEYDAARELVVRPLKSIGIRIPDIDGVVEQVWNFTSGHPCVIQSLCKRLIEQLDNKNDRSLNLQTLENLINDDNFIRREFLETFFSQASVLEYLCALLMANHNIRNLTGIHSALESQGIKPPLNQVESALERLVDLRSILKRTDEGYDFSAKAFLAVVRKMKKFDDLINLHSEVYDRLGDVDPENIEQEYRGKLW